MRRAELLVPRYGRKAVPETPPPLTRLEQWVKGEFLVGVGDEAADELARLAVAAALQRNGRPQAFVAAILELREAGEAYGVRVVDLEWYAVTTRGHRG